MNPERRIPIVVSHRFRRAPERVFDFRLGDERSKRSTI